MHRFSFSNMMNPVLRLSRAQCWSIDRQRQRAETAGRKRAGREQAERMAGTEYTGR